MFFRLSLLVFWLTLADSSGLKITKLTVPKLVDVRTSATLICEFDLENSKLYSVKWYKNDLEFCRFMPNGIPDVLIFKVEGVHSTPKQCNMTSVTLDPLDFTTSGLYTCEVSTEAPYFKTVQTASNMTVLGIPKRNPIITGLKDIYAVGEYVEGNCTSDSSYPAADLEWYINDNRVESWQLDYYPEEVDEEELKRSTLGVSFQVDHSHFTGKGNTMVFKCRARVWSIAKEAFHTSKLADLDIEKFAQGLYGNRGRRRQFSVWVILLLVMISRRWK